MKNILAIAALCLSGTQALKLTAESQAQVEAGSVGNCCGGKKRDITCCTPCDSCVCQSASAEFTTGQDTSVMQYLGVTSVAESPFWDTIQNTPFGMKAYQHYIAGIKFHQDAMCKLQSEIEILLAELNYEEQQKEDEGEYKDLIKLLCWISEYPQYALSCPYNETGDGPNPDLCTLLCDAVDAGEAGAAECKNAYEDIVG